MVFAIVITVVLWIFLAAFAYILSLTCPKPTRWQVTLFLFIVFVAATFVGYIIMRRSEIYIVDRTGTAPVVEFDDTRLPSIARFPLQLLTCEYAALDSEFKMTFSETPPKSKKAQND